MIEDIRYRGLRVPILEVTACLLDQPFISDAYVVPVMDASSGGTVVSAVLRLQNNLIPVELQEGKTKDLMLSLPALRAHLSP